MHDREMSGILCREH